MMFTCVEKLSDGHRWLGVIVDHVRKTAINSFFPMSLYDDRRPAGNYMFKVNKEPLEQGVKYVQS